jgi:endonuclease-3
MVRKLKPATSKLPARKASPKSGRTAKSTGGSPGAGRLAKSDVTRPGVTKSGIARSAAPKAKTAKAGARKAAAGPKQTSQASPDLAIHARKKTAKPDRGKPSPAKPASAKPKPWTAAEIEEAFRRLSAANPEPRGELHYINPFTLLVAVVLSAQATDAGVNKATPALFAAADTPEMMVALGEDKVRDMIRTIGLFRTKAKNVIALSEKLIAEHAGMVPPIREELEKLPGVGRKTANVVLNIAFGQETIAVDTHIFRVGNRTGIAPGKNPLEVESRLEERVPKTYRLHAHHWLILHGRYICKAQRPLCETCVINDLCRWPEKTTFMSA